MVTQATHIRIHPDSYLLGTKYHFYSMPVPALNTTCPSFSMIVIVSLTFLKFVKMFDCSTYYT